MASENYSKKILRKTNKDTIYSNFLQIVSKLSFPAGYIYKFINGHSVEECQKFGNLTGAVSTTAAGGTAAFENYEMFKKTAKERFGVDISVNND
mgnify:CR=1 FL=1